MASNKNNIEYVELKFCLLKGIILMATTRRENYTMHTLQSSPGQHTFFLTTIIFSASQVIEREQHTPIEVTLSVQ